ncbi:helix-turn-helix domain-containing protein [Bartonella bilalgolemii]|uniref:Helix-turn-helix domain-containing protein n=1 Tax=Bartonella bilalgolemii TaxID=2942911 RepID=A0ABT0PA59_9HYPH|nr:helix-turn-helix transcriptional regulator [Bartonella sp. G70]MCL6230375.1 helix-turn-helix domain-containing protein [Bartonella sp. G70]
MINVFHGSSNVYADLGFADSREMLLKAQLAQKISQILKEKKLTQKQAGQLLKMPQSKLSKLLNGEFRGISEMKMLECLTKLGNDVRIVVSPEKVKTPEGQFEVIFAS